MFCSTIQLKEGMLPIYNDVNTLSNGSLATPAWILLCLLTLLWKMTPFLTTWGSESRPDGTLLYTACFKHCRLYTLHCRSYTLVMYMPFGAWMYFSVISEIWFPSLGSQRPFSVFFFKEKKAKDKVQLCTVTLNTRIIFTCIYPIML